MLLRFITLASLLLLVACTTSTKPQQAKGRDTAPAGSSLVGNYTFSSGSAPQDVQLAVSISASGDIHSFDFQAWHPDAHGAAPDGSGTGRVDASGIFHFSYEDSFYNRGFGSFRRSQTGYQLSIDIDNVSDSRCMMFYGDFTLQRT